VEAFVCALPKTRTSRISLLRQFFRFARAHRIVLVNPTRGLSRSTPRGFTGTTLPLDQQRELFQRWTSADPSVHAHEALLGILALLHGASSIEVRMLRTDDIDPANHSIRLGRRPQPVPPDPASWSALQRCLTHRQSQHTGNPHVVVTRGTKAGNQPASTAYFCHLLDPAGVAPRTVRCTRLAALVNTMDPKLVAAAFGLNNEGVMFYLADRVDDARLPAATSNS
jgi:integrase